MRNKILLVVGILLLIGGGVGVYLNRQEAKRQVALILTADQQGAEVQQPLERLKLYVGQHMLSSVDLTLSAGYRRAQEAFAASTAAANASAQVYAEAQKACSGKSDSIVQAKCNAQYLATHLPSVPAVPAVPSPQLSAYVYKFSSPIWTPDLAGVMLLAGSLVIIWWSIMVVTGKSRRSM